MIHYMGLPITPDVSAVEAVQAGHAFISFRHPQQLPLAIELAQSFALDNGAFSAWRCGSPVQDWSPFYRWAIACSRIPACDFIVVPDAIDGNETDNDRLLEEWPLPRWIGAPVWHLHESLERLERLAHEWPRICLGSSGDYVKVGTRAWWSRMDQAMRVACDSEGRPVCKLHGLRMLNPAVFTRLPLASADSTNIARNIGIDRRWNGPYPPAGKAARARVMRGRIEAFNAPAIWSGLSASTPALHCANDSNLAPEDPSS